MYLSINQPLVLVYLIKKNSNNLKLNQEYPIFYTIKIHLNL